MSPHERVLYTLHLVDRRRRRAAIVSGLALWVAITAGCVLLASLLAGVFTLPVAVRWMLLGLMVGAPVLSGAVLLLRLFQVRAGPEYLARYVEQRVPGLGNGLINAVQLAADAMFAGSVLTDKAIAEAARSARRVLPEQVVRLGRLWRRLVLAGLVTGALAAYIATAPGTFAAGLRGVLNPRRFIPRAGSIPIVDIQPGDVTVTAGEPLTVTLTVRNDAGEALNARLVVLRDGRREHLCVMTPIDPGRERYRYLFAAVTAPFRYRLEVARSRRDVSQSRIFSVTVRPRAVLERLDQTYAYPPYTALPRRHVRGADGPIEAPTGSEVRVAVSLRAPAEAAELRLADGSRIPMRRHGACEFSGTLNVTRNGGYAVVLLGPGGQVRDRFPDPRRAQGGTPEVAAEAGNPDSPEAGFWPIRAIPDEPPTVAIVKPADETAVWPGAQVHVTARASDDYAVQHMAVWLAIDADGSSEVLRIGQPVAEQDVPAGTRQAEAACTIAIDPQRYKQGQTIWLVAVARDNRDLGPAGGPQEAISEPVRLTVRDRRTVEQDTLARLEALRKRIAAILKLQVELKAQTVLVKHLTDANELAPKLARLHRGQVEVQKRLSELAETFAFPQEALQIKQTLSLLARGEAADAVVAAASLGQIGDAARVRAAAETLLGLQGRIIDALRTLLGLLSTSREDEPAGALSAPGGDIPPDRLEALQKLADRLQAFLEQQKRVIETTSGLAKQPVDDWTAEDLAELKNLAALEDDWARFLDEAISDFSKLPEQDFASASLVQELIEIRDDVQMAEGALQQQAVEIAVPFEEAGLELAEELTTNLERWLPDTPDRQQWSMEEPLDGQTDVPMPELPAELTDIIGELMEQEEDLFEQIEDVTSQWADSLDKGAGWSAEDGPISNMSARGVTGNRLPNASEIGGRAGQGRSGRSSGEMVESTAHDLGGRRTPTRLSPDPFQTGQIDDRSTEPGGGATGGGKLSGAGGEGLEGPVPMELKQQLGRLAARQAILRNRAERIDLNYRAAGLGRFKLDEVVRLFRRVERDLADYRYQTVLRRKRVVLDALNSAYLAAAGQAQIHRETGPALPKRVLDDIADARSLPLPAAYKELLTKYYERLSGKAALGRGPAGSPVLRGSSDRSEPPHR